MLRNAVHALIAALTIGLSAGGRALAADPIDVDLELVLAVDVSHSMDFQELALQRDGYVAAFRHREVIDAILSGGLGRIAVSFVEWAGPGYQRVLVPWTILAGADDADAFAASSLPRP